MDESKLVAAFVLAINGFRTTRILPTLAPLPCRAPLGLDFGQDTSTCSTLPLYGVSNTLPSESARHRIANPEAIEFPRLAICFSQSFTSLESHRLSLLCLM